MKKTIVTFVLLTVTAMILSSCIPVPVPVPVRDGGGHRDGGYRDGGHRDGGHRDGGDRH